MKIKFTLKTKVTTRIVQRTIKPQSTMAEFATFNQVTYICRNPRCRAAIHTAIIPTSVDAPQTCAVCGTPYQDHGGDTQN